MGWVVRRWPAAVAFAGVVAAGLSWRVVTDGTVAKVGGDVLYAVMIYVFVLLIRPRTAPAAAFIVTCTVCWAVEFLQLTPLPAYLSQRDVLARLALGSTFHWPDLLAYVLGALIGWVAQVSASTHGAGLGRGLGWRQRRDSPGR